MSIKKINQFPDGSGTLSGDDVFLIMDNPSGNGTTKKISLSQVAAAIGGGGSGVGGSSFTVGTIDLHNGGVQNAQILQFDNASLQAVITGPTPPSGNNSQRMIIQGQRAQGNGEGGDVYLWGGDSDVNGGDIKIYAGDADASPGDGGYVNIDGGNGYANGGNVTITGGNSSENGGDVRLIAGSDNNGGGEVRITTGNGSNQWVFQNDGFLTIPNSGILLSNNTSVKQGSYDNSTGGQNGISLNCTVGYELNWQGGHLKSTSNNGMTTEPIYVDSSLSFNIGGDGVSVPDRTTLIENDQISLSSSCSAGGDYCPTNILNITSEQILLYSNVWNGSELIGSTLSVSSSSITFPDNTTQSSAGLTNSDRYIICRSGDDILAKYAAAKLLTPAGSSLSSTNRAYLIVMPGIYPLSEQWEIDAEFVDVIGLGSTPLDRGCNVAVTVTGYDINASANNVRIKGIGTPSDRAFRITGNKPLQVIEECRGGYWADNENGIDMNSFNSPASGTFINCTGGYASFGGDGGGVASGSFINCAGSDSSFCGLGGFSYMGGAASGLFINCSAGYYGFSGGYIGTASGSFVNCVGGDYSFGFGGTASGSFVNCVGGDYSFGFYYGIVSGSFINCVGGDYSFGSYGTASGKFLYCTLTTGTFPTLSGTGKYRLCIDGDYNVINADAP